MSPCLSERAAVSQQQQDSRKLLSPGCLSLPGRQVHEWRSFVAAGSQRIAWHWAGLCRLLLLNLCPVKRDWLV